MTLTCRDCNSEAGYRLESHLVRRLERDDFIAGVSEKPVRARVSIGDGEIGAKIYRYPDRIEIHCIPSNSDPQLRALALAALESESMPLDGELRLPSGYEGPRDWVAVLRMGYLLAFCYFGYEYILHPSVQQVRQQILCPDDAIVPSTAVAWRIEVPHGGNVIGLLYEPSQLRCFYAILPLSTAVVTYAGVVLPGLDADSQGIYRRWDGAPSLVADGRFEVVFLRFNCNFICDPKSVGFAGWLWQNLRRALATWAGKSQFRYDGSVQTGTDIWYGSKPYSTEVTRQDYKRLLEHFRGRTITLGTSRQPPIGSVGAWLMEHVTKRAIASYVGPILVDEGHAERVPSDSTKISFK